MSDTIQTENSKDENDANAVELAESNMINTDVSNIHLYEPMSSGQSTDKEGIQDIHINIHLLHPTSMNDSFSTENNHGEGNKSKMMGLISNIISSVSSLFALNQFIKSIYLH